MPFVLLSQIPYTGIDDMRPTGLFIIFTIFISALLAYGSMQILPLCLLRREKRAESPYLVSPQEEYPDVVRESFVEKKTENRPWEITI